MTIAVSARKVVPTTKAVRLIKSRGMKTPSVTKIFCRLDIRLGNVVNDKIPVTVKYKPIRYHSMIA